MNKAYKNWAIILASGTGERFGGSLPKQFVKINNKTLLEHCAEAFQKAQDIDAILVAITPGCIDMAKEILKPYSKVAKIIEGGATRKMSSYLAVSSIEAIEGVRAKNTNVLIHDCARANISQRIISDCIKSLKKHLAVCTAIQATDTIFEKTQTDADDRGKNEIIIRKTFKRSDIMCAQTPQCFKLSFIKKAHEMSKNDAGCEFTDDAGLVLKYNLAKVFIVEGEYTNFKITRPQDLYAMEEIFKNRNL